MLVVMMAAAAAAAAVMVVGVVGVHLDWHRSQNCWPTARTV
jgi:predicted porin